MCVINIYYIYYKWESYQKGVITSWGHCNGVGNEEAEIVVFPFIYSFVEVIEEVYQVKW